MTELPYPLVELVLSIGTWSTTVIAYPGFEGGLSVPEQFADEIDADPDSVNLRLADNSVCEAPIWQGLIELSGRTLPADIVALGSRCLLGREVLDQFEICFKYGREVEIRFPAD